MGCCVKGNDRGAYGTLAGQAYNERAPFEVNSLDHHDCRHGTVVAVHRYGV